MFKLTRKNFHKHINELIDYMHQYDNIVDYINDVLYYRNIQAICDRRAIYYEISRSEFLNYSTIKHFNIIKNDIELINKGFVKFYFDIQNNRRKNCKIIEELFNLELETKVNKYNNLVYSFIMPIDIFNNLLILVKMIKGI